MVGERTGKTFRLGDELEVEVLKVDLIMRAIDFVLPEQGDAWFKAYHKAKEMCGGSDSERRICSAKEITYLDALVRGVYARHALPAGHVITNENFGRDFYLAVPLQKGQLSCREIMNGESLTHDLHPDQALTIHHIDGPYAANSTLRRLIEDRGA